MLNHVATVGGTLFSRAVDNGAGSGDGGNMNQLPGWAFLVVFCDFLVFFPIFLYIGYTLAHIYPTLSIIEDPAPPAYERVSLGDANESIASDDGPTPEGLYKVDQQPALVTSSLRRVNKLLFTTAGWKANFRGIACAFVLSMTTSLAGTIFMAIPIFSYFGVLFASLATVQLNTTWTHIVISAPSSKPWYHRLPPLRKTFEATCIPVTMMWFATTVVGSVPRFLGTALGLNQWDPKNPSQIPQYGNDSVWKSILVILVVLVLTIFLVIPAQVVLVRVQASLLPPDEDAIVPFDRSFAGKLEPVIVGGKGYVTVKEAWATFSRASWIRLVKLLGKILAVTFAAYSLMLAIVVPEFILMIKSSQPVDPSN